MTDIQKINLTIDWLNGLRASIRIFSHYIDSAIDYLIEHGKPEDTDVFREKVAAMLCALAEDAKKDKSNPTTELALAMCCVMTGSKLEKAKAERETGKAVRNG